MAGAIRVLLVEDHHVVRRGLRLVLERDPMIVVVGETADAESMLRTIGATRPDVLLMDIQLPGLSGIEATELVSGRPNPPRVLILTSFDDSELVHQGLKRGASGYLLKQSTEPELLDAIRRVHGGESVVPAGIAQKLLPRYQSRRTTPLHESLSAREGEVLGLVVSGLSNPEIAQRLCLSARTVGNHVAAIYRKLNLNRRVEAVLYAVDHGLVDAADSPATSFPPHHISPAVLPSRRPDSARETRAASRAIRLGRIAQTMKLVGDGSALS